MRLKFALSIGLLIGALLQSVAAQPAGDVAATGLDWGLPIAGVPGKPLLQTKFTGPKSELSLEVEALQKVLVPAQGTLIHAGAMSSKQTGFVILHSNGWVSLITSPLSWESTSNLRPGSSVDKGQLLAVVRGGRSQIMRQIGWAVHQAGDTELVSELGAWAARADNAEGRPLWVERLLQTPEVNLKGLLGLGTLQLSLQAGSNSDDCSVRIANLQMLCQLAEQQDFLLPIGIYKLEVQTGKFFKSTATATSFVSSMDTIAQRIEKDDKGNFMASGYVVEQSEARKLAQAGSAAPSQPVDEAHAVEAQQRAQAAVAEQTRQLLAQAEEARLKQEADARLEQVRLARERELQAEREAVARQQAERMRLQVLAEEQARQRSEAQSRERERQASEARLAMQREAERVRQHWPKSRPA